MGFGYLGFTFAARGLGTSNPEAPSARLVCVSWAVNGGSLCRYFQLRPKYILYGHM